MEHNHHSAVSEAGSDEMQSDQEAEVETSELKMADVVETESEEAQLAALATDIRDQDDLERDIGRQADQLLLEQADERDNKRLEKTQRDKSRLETSIRLLEQKLSEFGNLATKTRYRSEIEHYRAQVRVLDKDLEQIQARIDDRHKSGAELGESTTDGSGNQRMVGESRRDFLIRTGKITPFSKMGQQLLRTSSSLGDVLLDAEEEAEAEAEEESSGPQVDADAKPLSHRNLLAPGFDQDAVSTPTSTADDTDGDAALARKLQDEEYATRPSKRRRIQNRRGEREGPKDANVARDEEDEAYDPVKQETASEGSADEVELAEDDSEDDLVTTPGIKRKGRARSSLAQEDDTSHADLAKIDDGNEAVYKARLSKWVSGRSALRRKFAEQMVADDQAEDATLQNDARADDEWYKPHPTRTDSVFEGNFRIPGDIFPSLFDYQKTGVQWLWELYQQQVGGIIGDEMGLGKTIQAISFIAGLHYSRKLTKPVIVVCPATVMQQWVNEFHTWWPPLRVSILHTSGSGMLDLKRETSFEDELEDESRFRRSTNSKGHKSARRIVDKVIRDGHVLVTTYSGLQTYSELLIPADWGYAILDEGHKIRNPNTSITIYCKELRTHNRIILSGTPMQNNLTELWSLFDFVYPMRLGTLVSFKSGFEIPIKQGGYANASNLQVETAMKCAEILKDTISPYLLQRFKVDVAADLPKKSERVLFCRLTKLQRDAYEWFLGSEDMKSIMAGKRQALYGVDILRKICNHPDLTEHKTLSKKAGYAYGTGAKSGKMQVVKALIEIWKRNGHKTLLFAQHRIMLDILEKFVQGMPGFNYRRMDGNTSIKDRQRLVDEFNRDQDLHVFLLTTKVGGLGVNLTGADRVIIYDPDWNPSTDVQARERAWRLGQKREVEIYRLMTAGTIEEKIYHRQIFKQFLTNKILKDPKQRQTFHLRDLHDLFTLGESVDGQTETGSIFKGTEVQLSSGDAQTDTPTVPLQADDATKKSSLQDVAGVSREEAYRGDPDNDTASDQANGAATSTSGPPTNNDDRVLSSIFARSGVHSALEHDAIINGRRVVRADPEAIAREARKVAAEAARDLSRAATLARALPAGVPTWTGQLGSAGRPPSPPPASRRGGIGAGGRGGRGGLSSAAVLASLQSQQRVDGSTHRAQPSRQQQPDQQPKGKEFLALIRDFLLVHGGEAYTQMLVDHFNRFCGSAQRTAEFREMLKTIAELRKGGSRGARGKWVLRDEFRPGAVERRGV